MWKLRHRQYFLGHISECIRHQQALKRYKGKIQEPLQIFFYKIRNFTASLKKYQVKLDRIAAEVVNRMPPPAGWLYIYYKATHWPSETLFVVCIWFQNCMYAHISSSGDINLWPSNLQICLTLSQLVFSYDKGVHLVHWNGSKTVILHTFSHVMWWPRSLTFESKIFRNA